MLHKCANPSCTTPFRKLSEGKLFLLETDVLDVSRGARTPWEGRLPRIEHYWLCRQCAPVLTLSFEKGRGMVTVPLHGVAQKMPAASVRLQDIRPQVFADRALQTHPIRERRDEA